MAQTRKIALVTGGNRGIGLETVRQLAEQDVEVYLAARTLQSAQEAAAKLVADGATWNTSGPAGCNEGFGSHGSRGTD